jgi:hypothetical protein
VLQILDKFRFYLFLGVQDRIKYVNDTSTREKKISLRTSNSMVALSLPNHDRPPKRHLFGKHTFIIFPSRIMAIGSWWLRPEIRRAEVRVPPASQTGQRACWDWSAGRGAMCPVRHLMRTEGSHVVRELYARSTLGGSLRRCKHAIPFTNIMELANEAIHWVSHLRSLMKFIYNYLFSNLHPPTPATGSGPKLWVPGSARQPLADLSSRRR